MVLNPELDTIDYVNINNLKARDVVLEIIGKFNLVREGFNLETKRYTWRKKNTNKKARLDFLISETSLNDINETSLFAGYSSDHSLVYFNMQFGKFKKGKSLWKFNNSL